MFNKISRRPVVITYKFAAFCHNFLYSRTALDERHSSDIDDRMYEAQYTAWCLHHVHAHIRKDDLLSLVEKPKVTITSNFENSKKLRQMMSAVQRNAYIANHEGAFNWSSSYWLNMSPVAVRWRNSTCKADFNSPYYYAHFWYRTMSQHHLLLYLY